MKINRNTSIIAIAAVMLLAFGIAGCGDSKEDETTTAAITVENPWARVSTANQENGAAYMKIESSSPDKLTKAEVDSSVADHAELHEAIMVSDDAGKSEMGSADDGDMESEKQGSMGGSMQGKMTMKEVPFISVPAELKPGGFHVMLIGLKKPIKSGDEIELTLTFEKAGEQKVTAVGKD